jgi:hypothetical protein
MVFLIQCGWVRRRVNESDPRVSSDHGSEHQRRWMKGDGTSQQKETLRFTECAVLTFSVADTIRDQRKKLKHKSKTQECCVDEK